jgi:hypothetical protein
MHRPRLVPPQLVGLCFNCLAHDHVIANCCFPSRCLHYRGTTHRARAYKRMRSPSSSTSLGVEVRGHAGAARRRRSPVYRTALSSDGGMVSGHTPAGHETSVLPLRGHPGTGRHATSPFSLGSRHPPPQTLSLSPPSGHICIRPATEVVVIPCLAELSVAEEALTSLALVALVGGNWPSVSPAEVRNQLELFYRIPVDSF